MNVLECKCSNVTERSEQSASSKEVSDEKEEGRYFKKEEIVGSCICNIDGKDKLFDKILITAESPQAKGFDFYEKRLKQIQERFRGKPSAYILPGAPLWPMRI
jgi:hypothetical protein